VLVDNPPRPVLLERERALLRLLAAGVTIGDAPARLNYSRGYVQRIRAETLTRLGAATLEQAVAIAVGRRLL
jgi:DNA-binding NarL/FixJ family response regulator